jgi:hypothetical protein
MSIRYLTQDPGDEEAKLKRIISDLISAETQQTVFFPTLAPAGLFVDAGVGFTRFSGRD